MKQWLACALGVALVACGGGADDGPPPPPEPIVKGASLAELQAYSMPSTQKAELRWTDWVDGETGFRVDKSVNNTWTAVATLPRTSGGSLAGVPCTWTGTLDAAPTPYRVVALLDGGREIALKALSGAAELKLGVPAEVAGAGIQLNMAEPVRGDVKLSVTGAPAGSMSARFFVDQAVAPLGPVSTTGPAFETPWGTGETIPGNHTLRLQLQYAPGTFVEFERKAMVDNPDFSGQLVIEVGSPATRVYVVPANRDRTVATSATLYVDGKTIATQNAKACHVVEANSSCVQVFAFQLMAGDYTAGPHIVQAGIAGESGSLDFVTRTVVMPGP